MRLALHHLANARPGIGKDSINRRDERAGENETEFIRIARLGKCTVAIDLVGCSITPSKLGSKLFFDGNALCVS